MTQIVCRTTATDIRAQLADTPRKAVMIFEFDDLVVHAQVTFSRSVVTDFGERLTGVLHLGHTVNVVLPPADSGTDTVSVIGEHDTYRHLTDTDDVRPPVPVLALEEWLRWQEAKILDHRTPVDDGPYAAHPRLSELPRPLRERIAEGMADRHEIAAVKALREHDDAMSIFDAYTIVFALRNHDAGD